MSKITATINRQKDNILLSTGRDKNFDVTELDPSELLASGLAKCTLHELGKYVKKKDIDIQDMSIRVELERENATKTSQFTVGIHVDKELSEVEERQILKAARNSYVYRLLSTKIVLHQSIKNN